MRAALVALVRKLQRQPPNEYTRGYIDALLYVLDWMEELEDE